ncbi:AAA family ATPase [Paenibacillus agaridevorans]|nr:AAA family ATPase [Paenibacillus agaridevorans]
MKLRKKAYTDWLRRKKKSNGQPYSENTISSYVSALTTAPARLSGIHLETTNVFEISDANQYRDMRLVMKRSENFDEVNEKAGNKAFQYSLDYYEDFLREKDSLAMSAPASDEGNENSASHTSVSNVPDQLLLDKNIILYGPPGTGKTYHTVLYAVAIIEKKPLNLLLQEAEADGYDQIKGRYEIYKANGQIAFTTFHQSYGYEEFIEGIKPKMLSGEDEESGSGDVAYEISTGIFKKFCETAQQPIVKASNDYGIRKDPTIWKVSLGGARGNQVKRDCFDNGRIRIGWDSYGEIVNDQMDYSRHGGEKILARFIDEMRHGDIVLVLYDEETIDAVGVVTGDYEWLKEMTEYKRARQVRWLVKDIRENILELNGNKVMTLGSVYRLNRIVLSDVLSLLQRQEASNINGIIEKNNNNYVFIIDEINRGNISKIFGELITLIEPSKRIGMAEQLMLRLPYSPELFGVPNNVYILATMNTADRSIARLDTALRRRFSFAEMMPDHGALASHFFQGELLNLSKMLETINRRIEVLYDREHMIGHAYFMNVNSKPSLDKLGHLFEHTIIPLLQEYFYDDYEKVRLVLGDNNKPEAEQFIVVDRVDVGELFGDVSEEDLEGSTSYTLNHKALGQIASYLKIYDFNRIK